MNEKTIIKHVTRPNVKYVSLSVLRDKIREMKSGKDKPIERALTAYYRQYYNRALEDLLCWLDEKEREWKK